MIAKELFREIFFGGKMEQCDLVDNDCKRNVSGIIF